MSDFKPRDPDFLNRVRASFALQPVMRTIGAELGEVSAGYAELKLAYHEKLTQQHGFIHAGIVSTIIDNAGGYAAFSLFEPGDGVLTVEFKINMMAPAEGDMFIARGQVIRPGRTLTVTTGEVVAICDGKETTCALMQQTIMRITDRPNVIN
jgi:uncharacterized protein (TIGR00369 family)